MCGIMQSGICRFTELSPGQFGLTKQLVSLFNIFTPQNPTSNRIKMDKAALSNQIAS